MLLTHRHRAVPRADPKRQSSRRYFEPPLSGFLSTHADRVWARNDDDRRFPVSTFRDTLLLALLRRALAPEPFHRGWWWRQRERTREPVAVGRSFERARRSSERDFGETATGPFFSFFFPPSFLPLPQCDRRLWDVCEKREEEGETHDSNILTMKSLFQVLGIRSYEREKTGRRKVPPQFMVELYNNVADPSGVTRGKNPYNAKVVRSFIERGTYRWNLPFRLFSLIEKFSSKLKRKLSRRHHHIAVLLLQHHRFGSGRICFGGGASSVSKKNTFESFASFHFSFSVLLGE